MNYLRAYDVTSNAFSLNQAAIVLENAPDFAKGKRYGARLDDRLRKMGQCSGDRNNYTKDQINYSRSYWYNFLPFYHMGDRTSYKLTDRVRPFKNLAKLIVVSNGFSRGSHRFLVCDRRGRQRAVER